MLDTLPLITSRQRELDTSTDAFGELEDSMDLIDDAQALRERVAEQGYLYLKGYLRRDEVWEARLEVARRLDESGWLHPDYPIEELVANVSMNNPFHPELAKNNAPLLKVLYDGPMMELYDRLFDGEARHFDFTWFRAVPPGHSTPPHMDIVYMGRGTHRLMTAWTPLAEVPIERGPLMILEKSHLHEKLNANYGQKDVDTFCINKRGEDYEGMGGGGNIRTGGWLSDKPEILRQRLGGRWLTTNFEPGDLLTFTPFTIHASLDNHSDRVRITSDSRYQLASEPVDERWIGENPIAHGPAGKRGMIC